MVTVSLSLINGLHCYGAELEPISFAHALNVQPSEEGWLGDATELFCPEYFAVRLVGDDEQYRHRGALWDHMRNELYRQSCRETQVTLETTWRAELMLYCYEFNSSYAEELFAEPLTDSFSGLWFGEGFCGDGSDDEDTLNSELLLTEEFNAPDTSQQQSRTLVPRRRVNMFSPTERKDTP